jgi:hypothetical protein
MSESARSRRVIALAAAYVVALQALLLPLSVAAGGPFELTLCATGASVDGSPSPAGHDSGCPCAAGCGSQCCVQTLAGPPQVTVAYRQTRFSVFAPLPSIEVAIRPVIRGPQFPRGPPAA